jgi:ribosomal protein S18 acetylase RimI-like enzyme
MTRDISKPDPRKTGAPVIRRATEADAEAIHGLVLELAEGIGLRHKVASTAQDIRSHGFGPEAAFEVLIADWNGTAVGLCLFFESFSSWDGRRGVYVQDLFVSDAARGLGLGRRLLAEAAALSSARGGSYLRLAVDSGNLTAQAFYQRAGLRWAAGERIYQARGDDFAALVESGKGTGS